MPAFVPAAPPLTVIMDASLVSCFTCPRVKETCATPPTIEDVCSEETLATAYAWLIERRKAYPPSSDIWSFRRGLGVSRQPEAEPPNFRMVR